VESRGRSDQSGESQGGRGPSHLPELRDSSEEEYDPFEVSYRRCPATGHLCQPVDGAIGGSSEEEEMELDMEINSKY
jgi:hypothetical protein